MILRRQHKQNVVLASLYPAIALRGCWHKRATWGFRGCGRIPYAAKLAILIIRAKIFNICAIFNSSIHICENQKHLGKFQQSQSNLGN